MVEGSFCPQATEVKVNRTEQMNFLTMDFRQNIEPGKVPLCAEGGLKEDLNRH